MATDEFFDQVLSLGADHNALLTELVAYIQTHHNQLYREFRWPVRRLQREPQEPPAVDVPLQTMGQEIIGVMAQLNAVAPASDGDDGNGNCPGGDGGGGGSGNPLGDDGNGNDNPLGDDGNSNDNPPGDDGNSNDNPPGDGGSGGN